RNTPSTWQYGLGMACLPCPRPLHPFHRFFQSYPASTLSHNDSPYLHWRNHGQRWRGNLIFPSALNDARQPRRRRCYRRCCNRNCSRRSWCNFLDGGNWIPRLSQFLCRINPSQVYKRKIDGEHRGGIPYYIYHGLKLRWLAVVAALVAFLAYGFLVPGIQSNNISSTVEYAFGIDPWITATIVTVLLGFVIVGGTKRIANVAQLI